MRRFDALPYVLSILLGSFLLFLIQPILGRILLPEYGGSPAVWNTCMVCFQTLLMGGYFWAHWSTEGLGPRRQMIVQSVLLVAAGLTLPLALPVLRQNYTSPELSILAGLIVTAGLPFTLLASNSSLVQRWYSLRGGSDPFWLYAASNAGSLLGLIGYPLLFEPLFGLTRGWKIWVALYALFICVSAVCMLLTRRVPAAGGAIEREGASPEGPPPTWSASAGWMFRAAVASSLLLSVTMKITTDLAPAPIFWMVPLAIYLVTFIIAFSPSLRVPRFVTAPATVLLIAVSLTGYLFVFAFPFWLQLASLLGTLFFGCLLCHSDLADSRPVPRFLTRFYLWISIGGAVGGALNTLVAPVVFRTLAEYPITLLLLTVIIHARGGYLRKFPRERMSRLTTYLPPVTIGLAVALCAVMIALQPAGALHTYPSNLWEFAPVFLLGVGLLLSRHPGQFEFVVWSVVLLSLVGRVSPEPTLERTRSFFGVMRVYETADERVLLHGTTVHGAQRMTGPLSETPLRYYHPSGPFGRSLPARPPGARIGVVGLGVGTLAMLERPGDHLTFLEIDRDVERLARRYFTYLKEAKGTTEVKIGDGRLLLRDTPDGTFDLLIVDAFSSDAIPTHLLTREALGIYMRKVGPEGIVVAHISNRHLDLTRVFRGWSRMEHRPVAVNLYYPTPAEAAQGASRALAVAVAPDERVLERLVSGGTWHWLAGGETVQWTDDSIDLIAALGHAM